jgi:cytochrome c peroxidase
VLAIVTGAPAAARADAAHPERLRGVDPADLTYTYAVGVFAPEYVPPPPGSYTLPPIDTVGDHPVVDADGERTTLLALKRNRLAVVAFVYTTCVEVTGCPVSLAVLQQLDRELAADPALGREVTLLTVSFDPERDTPARMAARRRLHQPRTDWRFLTTSGEEDLQPLLADFDQPVAKLHFPDGQWTGLFRHVLKVFLLDRLDRVRNVYSTGFLNPALVLNDLRTLRMEDGAPR